MAVTESGPTTEEIAQREISVSDDFRALAIYLDRFTQVRVIGGRWSVPVKEEADNARN
jgi:hypothetical protein